MKNYFSSLEVSLGLCKTCLSTSGIEFVLSLALYYGPHTPVSTCNGQDVSVQSRRRKVPYGGKRENA